MAGTKVYVGGLDPRVSEREVEDEFRVFGTLRNVWVARKPPGFAFIEYTDPRDAEDAVKKLDGKHGWRVEVSRKPEGGPRRGAERARDGCYECGQPGHFARECLNRGSGGGSSRGRRGSRSPPRRRSRSRSPPRRRSRSRSPPKRDRSPRRDEKRRSRSRSPPRKQRSPSPKKDAPPASSNGGGKSPSPARARSASPKRSPSPKKDDN